MEMDGSELRGAGRGGGTGTEKEEGCTGCNSGTDDTV